MKQTDSQPMAQDGPHAPVVRGAGPTDLARLYDPGVLLATAPVPPSPAALCHGRALLAKGPRESSVRVEWTSGVPNVAPLARLALAGEDEAGAWVRYLGEVTSLFGDLLGAEAVGVRMIIADGPHCSRFHVDQVLARGVLNLLGSRTEWLPDEDIDRSLLGHAGGLDDETSGLVRCWDRLQRAEHGALTVFKGTAWPGAAERAVVHRSPPEDGCRRLLLTLDWLD